MITGKGYTSKGGRKYNEDKGMLGIKNGWCYAVMADGLGGHGNGGQAAETAVQTIKACMESWPVGEKLAAQDVEQWFDEANQNVIALQNASCKMKTTLCFLYIDEQAGTANLAHLGDSRIYHFENGKCVFYTFDHSVSRMAVLAGEIRLEDIRFHVDRNKLLKAIGKAENAKAETREISLSRDSFHAFLVCTDGFWEYVTEKEMEQTLRAADSPEDWLKRMRAYVEEKAGEDNDNHSAIAIWMR